MITPDIVDGIRRLIDSFREKPFPSMQLKEGDGIPIYADTQAILDFTLREFVSFKDIYEGWQGKPGHLLTHAQALIELENLGYRELSRQGFDGHRLHAKFVREEYQYLYKNREVLVQAQVAPASPLKKDFWEGDVEINDWLIGHIFKYPYTVHSLLRQVDDRNLSREVQSQLAHLLTYSGEAYRASGFLPSGYKF